MRLCIVKDNVEVLCKECESFHGVIKPIEPIEDILEIECRSSSEVGGENCRACTGTLNYVMRKYGGSVALKLSEWYSK